MPSNRSTTHQRSDGLVRHYSAARNRQDEALRLRESGMSFIQIARLLGYCPGGMPNAQSADQAVRAARSRRLNEALAVEIETVRQSDEYNSTYDRDGRRIVAVEDLLGGDLASEAALENQGNRRASRRRAFVSERTFGVEAEFFGISTSRAADALREAGINVQSVGYGHSVTTYWRITNDSSVHGEGLELVSPIMRGAEGLAEVKLALNTLRLAGGKVDSSCGLHVHVGMDRLNGGQLMKVIDLYVANQATIDGLVPAIRHDNYYSRHISQTSMAQLRAGLANATTSEMISSVVTRLDRYRTVNVVSYAHYGTLEFRQHQGTLNGRKATAWIQLVLGIVEKAVTMDEAAHRFETVNELVEALPIDTPSKRYLEHRYETLANGTARRARG